jgi:hypothetical protein
MKQRDICDLISASRRRKSVNSTGYIEASPSGLQFLVFRANSESTMSDSLKLNAPGGVTWDQ